MYPHDQSFIDSVIAQADRPLAVRKSVADYLAKMDGEVVEKSSRPLPDRAVQWKPMIFLRWGLPSFFPTAKKNKDFKLIDAVLKGLVDGIKGFSSEKWPAAGRLLAESASKSRSSILDIYITSEDRDRLAGIIGELPPPALSEFTSKMTETNETRSSTDVFVPAGILLASRLVESNPQLAKAIQFSELCNGIKWLNCIDPEELVSATQVCKAVFRYQLDPRQGSGFRLHLASAPKSELAALAWALVVLVDECGWGPDEFSQLGDRRALRYLEKAVTRFCTQKSSKLIRLPDLDKMAVVKSAVRRATLSAPSSQESSTPSPQASSSPRM